MNWNNAPATAAPLAEPMNHKALIDWLLAHRGKAAEVASASSNGSSEPSWRNPLLTAFEPRTAWLRTELRSSGEGVPELKRSQRILGRGFSIAVRPELEVKLAELAAGIARLADGADAFAGSDPGAIGQRGR